MKSVKTKLIIDLISSLFIVLFAYTGITKLLQQDTFVLALNQSPVIGTNSALFAWLVPILELIVSVLLFIPKFQIRRIGLAASLILMLLFTFYIMFMILFADHLPCSCGGIISGMTWPQHLLFNIFFTILAGTGIWFSYRNKLFIAINGESRSPVSK